MKSFYFIPLLFLSACTTAPKIAVRPQTPSLAADTVRYPEVVRAYHFGRYVDPSNDLVMHEQHTVFRVEANTRWDLHPGTGVNECSIPSSPHDSAYSPLPINDAVLAEVNAQKLATVQILMQSRTLSAALGQFQNALAQTKTNLQATAALRVAVNEMRYRLDTLEAAPEQLPATPLTTTNSSPDPLSP
jgi:hypothetical protein